MLVILSGTTLFGERGFSRSLSSLHNFPFIHSIVFFFFFFLNSSDHRLLKKKKTRRQAEVCTMAKVKLKIERERERKLTILKELYRATWKRKKKWKKERNRKWCIQCICTTWMYNAINKNTRSLKAVQGH